MTISFKNCAYLRRRHESDLAGVNLHLCDTDAPTLLERVLSSQAISPSIDVGLEETSAQPTQADTALTRRSSGRAKSASRRST